MCIILNACGHKGELTKAETLSEEFPVVVDAADSAVDLPADIEVKQWCLVGDTLLILSTDRNDALKLIDINTWSLCGSAVTIGQGPEEFIMPSLIASNGDGVFLTDAAKGIFRNLTQWDSIGPVVANVGHPVVMNDACMDRFPYIRYVFYSPQKTEMQVMDVVSGTVTDSLDLSKSISQANNISTKDFKMAGYGEHSIVAYQGLDRIDVIKHSGADLSDMTSYTGNAPTGQLRFFYVDAACAEDFFVVVSMKGKDVTDINATPDLLIYGYDGHPIAKLSISFIPAKILVDSDRKRLIMMGHDDRLHLIDLPQLI